MGGVRPSKQIVRFGSFELNFRAGELRKLGVKIKLQEQPFQVLQILLEQQGEIVTRKNCNRRSGPAIHMSISTTVSTTLSSVCAKL